MFSVKYISTLSVFWSCVLHPYYLSRRLDLKLALPTMSARTPFIPSNSRPASRAAHTKDESGSSAVKDTHFTPDPKNPLHGDILKSPSLQRSSSKGPSSSDHSSSADEIHKPLNLNGLFKKGPGSQSSLNLSGRKSNEKANETSSLSSLAKTRSIRRDQVGPSSVLSPKPVNAVSTSELLSSTFKTPSLPASSVTNLHVVPEAHMPIADDEDSHPSHQYKFGNAPPQRVPQHERNILPSLPGLLPKHVQRDRASKKRSRADLDAEDHTPDAEMMYGNHMDSGPAKRYKGNASMQMSMESEYMEDDIERLPGPSYSPQQLSSPIGRSVSHQSRYGPHGEYQKLTESPLGYRANPVDQRQHLLQDSGLDGNNGMGPPTLSHGSNVSVDGGRGGDALDKLLGCHADAYIEDHTDKYEHLTAKWRDCSMEEWMHGADGKVLSL
ncbi:hypothetical protein BDP27DRAFT_773663 [Rhodocollybia butyracea]|uniref:Uncharacterized protein n=1 Tax=Rhodocollybia butyracea TaxID=206335 RepID=A0A9P5PSM1_9AGAR|nr:hypothetical protein BDP27DRAFT_773663 [Rhodocollybia butyracea]